MPSVTVLVSGEGTNLQALIDAAASGSIGATIECVLSDRGAARGLERARAAGIRARHVRVGPTRQAGYDDGLRVALRECAADLVVLAGYMRLLSTALVEEHVGRMINLHPSLLPLHPGLDTHRRVLEAGDTHHGATVHFVTPELDAGPPILQYRLTVHSHDTQKSLSARVHVGEHIILPRVVAWFCEGRLRLEDDAVILDGRRLSKPIVVEEDA
jgi:phosphoribosylglycinamide formyltransferase 1